jgi:hypothetical protein
VFKPGVIQPFVNVFKKPVQKTGRQKSAGLGYFGGQGGLAVQSLGLKVRPGFQNAADNVFLSGFNFKFFYFIHRKPNGGENAFKRFRRVK